jgi:hypothetical protein
MRSRPDPGNPGLAGRLNRRQPAAHWFSRRFRCAPWRARRQASLRIPGKANSLKCGDVLGWFGFRATHQMAMSPSAPEPPGHDQKITRNRKIFYKLTGCGAMAMARPCADAPGPSLGFGGGFRPIDAAPVPAWHGDSPMSPAIEISTGSRPIGRVAPKSSHAQRGSGEGCCEAQAGRMSFSPYFVIKVRPARSSAATATIIDGRGPTFGRAR